MALLSPQPLPVGNIRRSCSCGKRAAASSAIASCDTATRVASLATTDADSALTEPSRQQVVEWHCDRHSRCRRQHIYADRALVAREQLRHRRSLRATPPPELPRWQRTVQHEGLAFTIQGSSFAISRRLIVWAQLSVWGVVARECHHSCLVATDTDRAVTSYMRSLCYCAERRIHKSMYRADSSSVWYFVLCALECTACNRGPVTHVTFMVTAATAASSVVVLCCNRHHSCLLATDADRALFTSTAASSAIGAIATAVA